MARQARKDAKLQGGPCCLILILWRIWRVSWVRLFVSFVFSSVRIFSIRREDFSFPIQKVGTFVQLFTCAIRLAGRLPPRRTSFSRPSQLGLLVEVASASSRCLWVGSQRQPLLEMRRLWRCTHNVASNHRRDADAT